MSLLSDKPRVMLHYILPPNTSGPNTSMERIETSWLKNDYVFGKLVQNERPGKSFNHRLLKNMIQQVKEFKPDIVHISGLQSAGFYAVLAARLGGCKNIVTSVRGSSVEAIGFNKIFKFIYRYGIEPFTMRMSTAVYTVCEDMSKKFGINKRKNYAGVIHNPAPIINDEIFNLSDFRNEISVDDNVPIVVCVGRMTYDKGISFIIEAIKNITNTEIKFVFVGDGPYYDILQEELKDEITSNRVFVLGKRNDVLNILAGCDVFLFSTLHENLSNALLEACSMGLAVIATSVGGNPEVISNEVNGLLIPPGNSDAIVKAVNRLCTNSGEISKFGEEARINIENNFSQENIYQKVKSIYESVLQGRRTYE